MLKSLYSAVSGLKNQQTKMDVTGNNIANVSTVAFKTSRVTFKDMLSQTIQDATAPTEGLGGSNAKQVGLGVTVGSIDTDMSQGSLDPTGVSSDLALDGNGFFIVAQTDNNDSTKVVNVKYTRDGAFTLDSRGNLVTSDGYHVRIQRPLTNADGKFDYLQDNLILPTELHAPVSAAGFNFGVAVDSTGNPVKSIVLQNDTALTQPEAAFENGVLTIKANFTNANNLVTCDQLQATINSCTGLGDKVVFVGGSADIEKALQLPADGVIGENIDTSSIEKMKSYSIEATGNIRAIYGNSTVNMGQIILANFQNPAGLTKIGNNSYTESSNSGQAQITTTDKVGTSIRQSYLEASKVDLATEFTNIIITSKAYQANSKVITASDELLDSLLSTIR
jgi:flagellar hook protein FlgE